MATVVNIHEAKTHFSRLAQRAHEGEEIIIARGGKPWARLMPLEDKSERVPGLVEGKLTEAFFEELPEEELAAWER